MSGDQFNNANYWRNQSSTEADKLQREKEKNRKDNEAQAEQQKREQSRNTSNVNYLQAKLNDAEKEIEYYKSLLTKPMHEIATLNGDFKKTYQEQQTILAEWMVSQRAFKELVIQLGIEAGRTKEDIVEEAIATKTKVLNCETQHGNDFNTDEWSKFYAPRIKEKMGIK